MSNKLRYLRPVASYSSPLCLRLAIYHFKSELQLNFLKLSIPLHATAFKFATSNSFRFRYVRQLSSSLRPTAFDSVTCNSFQVLSVYEPLPNYFCFDIRSVILPRHKISCSLYILSQLDHAYSIYFTNDPLILLNDSPGLHLPTKDHTKYVIDSIYSFN